MECDLLIPQAEVVHLQRRWRSSRERVQSFSMAKVGNYYCSVGGGFCSASAFARFNFASRERNWAKTFVCKCLRVVLRTRPGVLLLTLDSVQSKWTEASKSATGPTVGGRLGASPMVYNMHELTGGKNILCARREKQWALDGRPFALRLSNKKALAEPFRAQTTLVVPKKKTRKSARCHLPRESHSHCASRFLSNSLLQRLHFPLCWLEIYFFGRRNTHCKCFTFVLVAFFLFLVNNLVSFLILFLLA